VSEAAGCTHDTRGQQDLGLGGKLFIPISLGNHYYNSKILKRIIVEFISKSELAVIFICDRLRLLSYLIRGDTDRLRIHHNILVQIAQLTQVLVKSGVTSYPNARVVNWSFCQEDPEYNSLLGSLGMLAMDRSVSQIMDKYAAELINQFDSGVDIPFHDRIRLQKQYILEETALSLYMTEIRGYNIEVYRRGMGFVDYLHHDKTEELKLLTGQLTLKRKFISIEDAFALDESNPKMPLNPRLGSTNEG
jgi:hypothetical protein